MSAPTPPTAGPTVVREFPKNRREVVRACLSEYEGRQVADLRIWAPRRDGTFVPTMRGVTIDRGLLPQLEEAVHALVAEAAMQFTRDVLDHHEAIFEAATAAGGSRTTPVVVLMETTDAR